MSKWAMDDHEFSVKCRANKQLGGGFNHQPGPHECGTTPSPPNVMNIILQGIWMREWSLISPTSYCFTPFVTRILCPFIIAPGPRPGELQGRVLLTHPGSILFWTKRRMNSMGPEIQQHLDVYKILLMYKYDLLTGYWLVQVVCFFPSRVYVI